MRKLASIKTITNISPIEGKDRIELAHIDGWQSIVKKGEYIIGDITIFIEPDAVLPDRPEFDFLRKNNFRIKTMKLGGVLSQGVCFPLSILPQLKDYKLGDDVTDFLGIKQYEATMDVEENNFNQNDNNKKFNHPIFKFLLRYSIFRKLLLPKKQNKGFPDFISKTDETRCQNMPSLFNDYNKKISYVVREKIDGQSGTFFIKKLPKKFLRKQKYDFGVCSRNMRLWNEFNSSQWFVANKYKIKEVLEELIGNNDFVAIQGECIAPKVQGNKYKVSEPDLYVFNLIYPYGKVDCILGEDVLNQYGIKWCPIINHEFTLPNTMNELLDYSTGTSKLYPTLREGIVLRNYENKVSFKAVSPDFLIKNDE